MNNVELYSISRYAKEYNVTRATVYRWIKQGRLETVEIAKGILRIKVIKKDVQDNG